MISLKLLSAVYGTEVIDFIQDKVEYNTYVVFTKDNPSEPIVVNIYELAHKVKEWAIGLGYTLTSSLHSNGSMCLAHEHNAEFEDYSHKALSNIKFEPETIIMVGELILENRL